MSRISSLVAIVLVIGCASASAHTRVAAQQPAAAAGTSAQAVNLYARIPAEIGAFKLTERTAVRGLPTDSLFRFSDGSPTILTVIIYDVADDVRVDADSQQWTAREGEKFKAVQDIRASRGQIAAYELAFSDTTRIAAGERTTLEHSIAAPVRFPNGAIAVEMQYLYLIGGKFVKVRATIPEKGWEQTQVPAFARELALRLARRT
jgi:hypothetical protein